MSLPSLHRAGAATWAGLLAALMLAGCAAPAHTPASSDQAAASTTAAQTTSFWSGRLSVQVASEPPKTYAAAFELSGEPDAGELRLFSPLGSTLAQAQWRQDAVTVTEGNTRREFASLDDMGEQLMGSPIPVKALFAWLRGDAVAVPGWHTDLSRAAEGRISASRLQPLPQTHVRVVLDSPTQSP